MILASVTSDEDNSKDLSDAESDEDNSKDINDTESCEDNVNVDELGEAFNNLELSDAQLIERGGAVRNKKESHFTSPYKLPPTQVSGHKHGC